MYISRTFDARTARIALLLIRRPLKSRRYPAEDERLVTPQEAALLARSHRHTVSSARLPVHRVGAACPAS